jgi:hypothetical protein
MAILHFQWFGINIDEGLPDPNEDGTYPNDDEDRPDEIDEMITDEDIDPDSLEPSEDDEEDE